MSFCCITIFSQLLLFHNILSIEILFIVTGNAGNEEDVLEDFLNGTLIQDEIPGSNSTAQVLSVK